MMNQPMSATTVRLLLSETLWLEPEYYEQARANSPLLTDETQQWQVYLNILGRLAFTAWLGERLPDDSIHQISHETPVVSTLSVSAFKLCLIATEHVLDEVISVPRNVIEEPALAAHFYVVLEVLEDQEQVVIRGFLRHDELVVMMTPQSSEFCRFPLAAFDPEINHLVFYVQQVDPAAILLPVASVLLPEPTQRRDLGVIRTRLSQWLQGTLDEGWQTVETLINPDAHLAWSTRNTPLGAKGGKLINFGVQLGQQTIALLVTVTPENEGKIGINIQVLPGGGALVLPPQLCLTLLSDTNKLLQEVESREQDNYIQLKPFKGKRGIHFSIEVSLHDIRVREAFEL